MSIWAEIKKSINSNLNKPLNITLDEIQESVNAIHKSARLVKNITGIPYNTTTNAQVLTLETEPVFSVNGVGRILKIIPITNTSSGSRSGTVLLSIDDEIVLNNAVNYAYNASDTNGRFIVNDDYYPNGITVYSDIYSTNASYTCLLSQVARESALNYINVSLGLYSPNGIPFKEGFKLRLTQSIVTDISKAGVIVVYELYE